MLLVYPQRNGTSAPPAARLSESVLNLNTPARQNASKLAFVFGLFVLWLCRRYSASAMFKLNLTLPSLIRILALPKILSLGKMQVNLLLLSLIRILASPKILRLGKNASELAFFSRLIRIFVV